MANIPLNDAKRYVQSFRNRFVNEASFKKAILFDASDVSAILSQQGCTGLRVYFGINDSNNMTAILVGVDATGTDMIAVLKDVGSPCPPTCSTHDKTLCGDE